MEYIPRQCEFCSAVKSKMEDGKETLFPCKCDWGIEVRDRVKKTVHPTYHDKMIDSWSPKIFNEDNSGKFKRFVKIQKAVAIQKIYDYAFKPVKRGGVEVNSLSKSIAGGKNLFIRGPRGSGRGLLLACVKVLAAGRGITANPLPGTFDAFKDDLIQTKQGYAAGVDARILCAMKYQAPSLLAIEGVKGEYFTNYKGEKIPKKHLAADSIDWILTQRLQGQGSLLFAGQDFIQEIADTAGDRLAEVLTSDKTDIILLFSPDEANALLTSLIIRKKALEEFVETLISMKFEDKKTQEKNYLKEQGIMMQQALYFERAFPEIPQGGSGKSVTPLGHQMIEAIKEKHSELPKILCNAYREFLANEEAKDSSYLQGIKDAQVSAVRECKVLASRMSEKEMTEAGRLIGMATMPKEEVAKTMLQARAVRDEMTGKKDLGIDDI